MNVVVEGLLVQYQITGKGPVVVLLHGWGDTSATFAKLITNLKDTYQLVSLDLPGFGQTQPPKNVWGLSDYARFVQAFLAKVNVRPHAFVAHSNGGAIAIYGLAHDVLKADKLVLLASAGIRDRQKIRRVMLKLIAKVGKVVTFWLPHRHKKALQKKLYGAVGSDLLVAPHLQETFKITVRQDVQKDAALLHLPVLLIYGEEDRATPPLYGRIYHKQIQGSQLEILAGAEHFVHQDHPEKVAALIKEFL